MARLTTHVLDTSAGRPAAALRVELDRLDPQRVRLTNITTNHDGRVERPLLEGPLFEPGVYELRFHAADYFRARGVELPDPPFLDIVVIRFGIAGDQHYHVPLLLSPYGYSTYRGS